MWLQLPLKNQVLSDQLNETLMGGANNNSGAPKMVCFQCQRTQVSCMTGGPDFCVFHYCCTDISPSAHTYGTAYPGVGGGRRLSLFHWWAGLVFGCTLKRGFCCSWSENNTTISSLLCLLHILDSFHSRLDPQMDPLLHLYHRSAWFCSYYLRCWFLRPSCRQIASWELFFSGNLT